MKELSVEEKAKAYDEALEKAMKYDPDLVGLSAGEILEDIFPELAESEDERIRKALLEMVHDTTGDELWVDYNVHKEDAIAYLEKQGEQKPWSEEDEINRKAFPNHYGGQKPADKVEPKFNVGQTIKKEGFNLGFTIAKIEDGFYYSDEGDYFPFTDQDNWELVEQELAWSEEDETALGDALWCCKQAASIAKDENDMGNVWYAERWLKSLKDRCLPQSKQGWSQNDIDMIDWLIRCCEKEHEELCNDKYGHQDIVSDLKRDCRKKWNWLESLKNKVVPQNTWKPSEEQLEAINTAINVIGKGTLNGKELIGLLEQLKAL